MSAAGTLVLPDLDGHLPSPLSLIEVRDIYSLLYGSIVPQTNMVMQTCCPMNVGRSGARRHLNQRLMIKRKPIHLGFDEDKRSELEKEKVKQTLLGKFTR